MKFFSLLFQNAIHPSDGKKIIPKEEFSQLLSAHQVLEQAKEDAENFLKQTKIDCDLLKEQAQKEGYQEGLVQFDEHLLAFDALVKQMRQEMQQQILPLALRAAKKIVAKELEQHPETIVDIVRQALLPVTQNHRIAIYVNKADKEILEKEKPKLREIFERIEALTIQERSDIERGGCIIETESGIINAEIDNQWRALETAFERYTKQR